ncbi:Intradiol ring-cleavage dioxygenase [Xylariales sp. PMI_506]|nr:Intradiol ring-cleavage dioxygenase [Xylariales sp. PMI_506]
MYFTYALLTAYAAASVAAHPGADVQAELLERRRFLSNVKRADLSHCSAQFAERGIDKRAIQRRKELVKQKAPRSVLARAASDINKSHLSDADYTADTPLDTVFAANSSCLLSPEETEGPYYVAGEYIRQDVTEDQAGVPLTVDVAIFDVETCEPITDVWVEIWHCNATGVYSGVASGGGFSSAPENLDTTFLRGFQQTDSEGAIQFDTLFPGHYSGRTQHIHIMVHPDATARDNDTIVDTTASHVGQMYFDQSLIDEVEQVSPYSTNTQAITTNAQDSLLADGLATSDPIMEYVLLGSTIDEGLLAWLSFGVNTTYSRTASAAATYYASGGVASSGSGAGAGGGGPGGPGGASA